MACAATLILAVLGCAEPEPGTEVRSEVTKRQALTPVRVTQTVAAGGYHSADKARQLWAKSEDLVSAAWELEVQISMPTIGIIGAGEAGSRASISGLSC